MLQPKTQSAPAGGKLTITPQSLQAKMRLAPAQASQLQRIEVAGMKVMFSPQTRQMLQQAMAGNAPLAQKIGVAVAGLLGLLMKESQNSIPRQLLLPAGILLVAHAAEFLAHAGTPVNDQDVAKAIEIMQAVVMRANGVDSNKLAAIGARGKIPAAAPAGAPPGGMPPSAAQPPMGA